MMDSLTALWNRIRTSFETLTLRQQISLVAIVATGVFIVGGLLYWSTRPQWVVLYNRQLEHTEAAQIARKLDDLGVRYRLDGSVVQVPLSRVDRLRLQLAEAGIQPSSTVGFEIFEEGGIGVTDFERQVRYKRALEGSLARAIQTNPEIQEAQVNLAMPRKQALFRENEEPVTASIKLSLRPYETLRKDAVRGIMNLVSYGVVGLDPANVVVTDQQDRILSESVQSDASGSGKQIEQLQVKHRIEQQLRRKLNRALGRVLSRDRISAEVTVEMDFDRVKKQLEQYRQPEGAFEQLKVSEDRVQRAWAGTGMLTGGPAGTESNLPGFESVDTGGANRYDETHTKVNYFADKTITTVTRDPSISRVSAVLTVDGQYNSSPGPDGTTEVQYSPPGDEQMEKIRRLARAAIGYNEQRGDRIEVTHLQFDRPSPPSTPPSTIFGPLREWREPRVLVLGVGGGLLLLGAFWFWLRRRSTSPDESPEDVRTADLISDVRVEERNEGDVMEQVLHTTKENPDNAAQVLRTWFVNGD